MGFSCRVRSPHRVVVLAHVISRTTTESEEPQITQMNADREVFRITASISAICGLLSFQPVVLYDSAREAWWSSVSGTIGGCAVSGSQPPPRAR